MQHTNSMLQVSSWEPNSSSAGQEIPKNSSNRIILLSFLIFYNYNQILYCYLSRIPTLLRSALFWDFMQYRMVVLVHCFRTTYQSLLFFDYLTLKDGTNRFSRNVSMELPFCTMYNSKNSTDLIYIATQA
jgi:hypothetical protein